MSVVQTCPATDIWPGQSCKYDNKHCCAGATDPNSNSMTWSYQQWVIPPGTPAGQCGANGSNCQSVVPLCTSRFSNRAVCNDHLGENSAGDFRECMPGFSQIFNVDKNGPSGLKGAFTSNPPVTQQICQPTMNMEDIVNKYVGKAWGDGARNDYLNNNNNRIDNCVHWVNYGGKYFSQVCAADITDPSGTWYKEVVAGKLGYDGKPIDLETGMLGKTRCAYPFYSNDAKGSGCWHLTSNQGEHTAMGLGDNYFNGSMDGSQSGYRANSGDGQQLMLNTDGVFINRPAVKDGNHIDRAGPGDCSGESQVSTPWNDGRDCSDYV